MLKDPIVKKVLINIVEDEKNLSIIKALLDGINTDEKIHEKTKIKLNIVRKILYRLYDFGLASYKRSKDPETQWFTYSWKFEEEEIYKIIKEDAKKGIKYYTNLLEEEQNNMFFICPEKHIRCNYNEATEFDFICPECGEELKFENNEDIIKEYEESIKACKENYERFSEKNG